MLSGEKNPPPPSCALEFRAEKCKTQVHEKKEGVKNSEDVETGLHPA